MRKKDYKPYGINIEYELKTYKYVGMDYGNYKTANRGVLFNLKRFLRKICNKGERKYKFCNTYSEWETHVNYIVRKDITNYRDFVHWLYGKRNDAKEYLEAIKTILIPLYIAIFSLIQYFDNEKIGFEEILVGAILISFFSLKFLCEANEKVNFYKDLITIIERNPKYRYLDEIFQNHLE